MADFSSFLLNNINLLGLKESNSDDNCTSIGNKSKAERNDSTLSSSESEYVTVSTGASVGSKANTSNIDLNNAESTKEPCAPPKRRSAKLLPSKTEPSQTEIASYEKIDQEPSSSDFNTERASERDAQSPKPIRHSASHGILQKLKKHDFSNFKSIFNRKDIDMDMDKQTTKHAKDQRTTAMYKVTERTNRLISDSKQVSSEPHEANPDNPLTDLSKLFLSLLAAKNDTIANVSADADQIEKLLNTLFFMPNKGTNDQQTSKNIRKQAGNLKVQSSAQCSNAHFNEKQDSSRLSENTRFDIDNDDDDSLPTSMNDTSVYSCLNDNGPNSNIHHPDHLYNELNEFDDSMKQSDPIKRRPLKSGNLKSYAETLGNESSLTELEPNSDSSNADDDDKVRRLKQRLKDIAKLKRPERKILYNEWFKIIKKLETDPKFDLEALIRTRGRFSDHTMISYRDRYQRPLDPINVESNFDVLRNSAKDLNFFKGHTDVMDQTQTDLRTSTLDKPLRLMLQEDDIDLIKQKIVKNKKKLFEPNSDSGGQAMTTKKCSNSKHNKREFKQLNNDSKEPRRPTRRASNDVDLINDDEAQHNDDPKSKRFQCKSKIESAKDFCDGLSRIVKDKIENRLKPFMNNNSNGKKLGTKYDDEYEEFELGHEQKRLNNNKYKHECLSNGQIKNPRQQLSNIKENSIFDETVDFHRTTMNESDADDRFGRHGNPPKRPPPPRLQSTKAGMFEPNNFTKANSSKTKPNVDIFYDGKQTKYKQNPASESIQQRIDYRSKNSHKQKSTSGLDHSINENQSQDRINVRLAEKCQSNGHQRSGKMRSSSPILSPIISTTKHNRHHEPGRRPEQPTKQATSKRVSYANDKRRA